MILELTANGISLDIKGISFNLTLRSPVADQSGSYVYSFTIPNTVQNAKAFKFPHRLTRMDAIQTKVSGTIKGDGAIIREGIWFAKSTNIESISIEMYIGKGSFNETVHDKLLPELFDIEVIYNDILAHISSQIELSFPNANHNWPSIYNPNMYGTDDDNLNPQFKGIINDWEGTEIYISTSNNNAISPQLYLGYIIKRIFEYAGYSLYGNVFEDPQFKHSMLYNNFTLDKLVPTSFYGEMSNAYPIYSDHVLIWDENLNDPGNHYNQSTGKCNVDKQGRYRIDLYLKHRPSSLPTDAYAALLEIYYGTTLIHSYERGYPFENTNDFTLTYDYTEEILQADIGDDLWCKYMYLDSFGDPMEVYIIEGNITIQNIDAVENNTFNNIINYKNHVPELDVKQFIEIFFSSAKILPFFDDSFKEVKLVFFDNLLGSNKQLPFSDGIYWKSLIQKYDTYKGINFAWNYQGPDENLKDNFIDIDQADILGTKTTYLELIGQSATEGDIYFITTLNCYYIWELIDNDSQTFGWKPYSDNQYNEIVDDGKEAYSCELAPILMRAAPTDREGVIKYRNLPSVIAKGSSIGYGLKNDFPLRIMFWHGIESNDNDGFPIATTTKYSTEGTQLFDMNWKWDEISNVYFLNYIRWMRKRFYVEFTKEITATEISNLDFETKGNVDGGLILFTEMQAKLATKKIIIAKYRGWG